MFSMVVIHNGNTKFFHKFWRSITSVSLLVFIVKSTPAEKIENEITCSTPGCENAGNILKNNINEQIDPCNDFYSFACGGFLDSASIPENQSAISQAYSVQTKIFTQIKEALEENVNRSEPRIFELAKNYYKSCLNESTRQQNLETLLQIIQQLGGWPVLEGDNWEEDNFSVFETDAKLRKIGYKPNHIFKIFTFPHLMNTSKSILTIAPPDTAVKSNILSRGMNNPVVKAYYKYMVDVAVLLGADKNIANTQLRQAVQFERNLVFSKSESAIFNTVNVEPIKKLYELGDFPWLKYINDMTEPIVHFENDSFININDEATVERIAEFIGSENPKKIANYMIWKVIAESIKYLPDEYRDKAFEFEKINSEKLAYPPKPPRWLECIGLMIDKEGGLAVAASSMYIRKHFNDSLRKEVEPIISSVVDAAKEIFNKTAWMSETVRAVALRKIDYMRKIIAYPNELLNDTAIDDYSRNLTITNDHFQNFLNLQRFHYESDLSALHKSTNEHNWIFFSDSTEVNAYYYSLGNTFVILAAILQEPLFNPQWPSYVRFGTAGFIIGHEMMHAYDPHKISYNELGNLVSWLDDRSKSSFIERLSCLLKPNILYKDLRQTNLNLDLPLTLAENVADNGGIKIAYHAYRKWVEKNGEDPRLSQLRKYSDDQLFFIGVTNYLCVKSTRNRRIDQFKYEVHTPSDKRTLMMLRNSKEFAEAYHCSFGSRMNPEKKCNIWE